MIVCLFQRCLSLRLPIDVGEMRNRRLRLMRSYFSTRLVTIQLITAIDERDRNPGESNHERVGCDAREEVEQSCQTSEQQSGCQEKPSFYRLQYSTIRESRTYSVAGSFAFFELIVPLQAFSL